MHQMLMEKNKKKIIPEIPYGKSAKFFTFGIIACVVIAVLTIGIILLQGRGKNPDRVVPPVPPQTTVTQPVATSSAGLGCVIGGCSNELCVAEGEDVASPCIWTEEFACYEGAICEKQDDGKCGWTQTAELTTCIDQARKVVPVN